MTYPMLAVWAAMPGLDPPTRRFRSILGVALGLLLVPLILVTGSRGGLLLAAVAVLMAGILYLSLAGHRERAAETLETARLACRRCPCAGRFARLSRLPSRSRFAAFVRFACRYRYPPHKFPGRRSDRPRLLPLGSRFGTFEPIFEVYEPTSALDLDYLNHAHNDLLEWVLTGGLPALLLLGAFLLWRGRAVGAYRRRPDPSAQPRWHGSAQQ